METIFDEEDEGKFIPVGEETKDIIYVSNLSRDMMKIQISTKEDTREIWNSNKSTNHHLEKNEAVEFEFIIKPLWITSIEGMIWLFTVTMKKGNETLFIILLIEINILYIFLFISFSFFSFHFVISFHREFRNSMKSNVVKSNPCSQFSQHPNINH